MEEYICPLCNNKMVKRRSYKHPNYEFWGCSMYPESGCSGKRALNGEVFGIEKGEYPIGLGNAGKDMFDALDEEDMSFEEREDISREWDRQEEDDPFK